MAKQLSRRWESYGEYIRARQGADIAKFQEALPAFQDQLARLTLTLHAVDAGLHELKEPLEELFHLAAEVREAVEFDAKELAELKALESKLLEGLQRREEV